MSHRRRCPAPWPPPAAARTYPPAARAWLRRRPHGWRRHGLLPASPAKDRSQSQVKLSGPAPGVVWLSGVRSSPSNRRHRAIAHLQQRWVQGHRAASQFRALAEMPPRKAATGRGFATGAHTRLPSASIVPSTGPASAPGGPSAGNRQFHPATDTGRCTDGRKTSRCGAPPQTRLQRRGLRQRTPGSAGHGGAS